jgi:hypothetical protein
MAVPAGAHLCLDSDNRHYSLNFGFLFISLGCIHFEVDELEMRTG